MNKYIITLGIIIIFLNKEKTTKEKFLLSIILLLSLNYTSINNLSITNKTFYIDEISPNNLSETLEYILLKRNWKKVDMHHDKIGFVYSNNNSILNSEMCYKIFTQNSDILKNKIYFDNYFNNTEYNLNYIIYSKENLIKNINIIYQIPKKYIILKDPFSYDKKQIFIFDKNNTSKSYKKKIIQYIYNFKSRYVLIDSFYDSITFKVPELNYNNEKINIETPFGRRSIIRFFIFVLIRENYIEIYKINNLFVYLAVLPSLGDIKKDINNFGSYVTNNYIYDKDIILKENLSKNQIKNINLYKKCMKSLDDSYYNEIYNKLFALNNDEFRRQKPKDYNLVNEKIDDFIKLFGEKFKDELSCKNMKCLNKNYKGCFNIYGIDTIFTKDKKLKVLEISPNPKTILLKAYKKNRNIYNTINIFNDIFNLLEFNSKNLNNMKLITKLYRKNYNKSYYISENQVKLYPEIINSLKKRNYLRNNYKKSNNQTINLYLGYIIRNENYDEDDKDLYFDYLYKYLNDFDITNKVTGSIYELGDKSTLYNHLKKSGIIPDFINFKVLKKNDGNYYVDTKSLLQIQTFINSNITICSRFILKPSLGSQGKGIEVIRYYEQFLDWLKTPKFNFTDWSISEFLNPITITSRKLKDNEPRKSHIRSYFIITKYTNNKIDVYELNKRLLYFAVDSYISTCVSLNDQNKYSFITNLALASEERNTHYDTSNYTDDLSKYKDQIFNYKKISKLITEYGLKCIDIIYENNINCFNENCDNFKGCFQIIAIDYLLIEKNKLVLLEVNKGPGFKALKVNFNLENIFDEIFSVTIDKLNGIKNDIDLKYLVKIK